MMKPPTRTSRTSFDRRSNSSLSVLRYVDETAGTICWPIFSCRVIVLSVSSTQRVAALSSGAGDAGGAGAGAVADAISGVSAGAAGAEGTMGVAWLVATSMAIALAAAMLAT